MLDSILRPVTLPRSLLGSTAPCDLFNARGTLLLRSGAPIPPHVESSRHRNRVFCLASHAEQISAADPVGDLKKLAARLSALAEKIEFRQPASARGLIELAEGLFALWSQDADACLGYVRRVRVARPSVHHAVHAALLAAELAAATGSSRPATLNLIGAALTMNVGSMILHDEMFDLVGEPDAPTQDDIHVHPAEAARLLERLGGLPDEWITTVLESHERLDGSGYPLGLRRAEISLPARMLHVADTLAACLGGRRARPPRAWLLNQTRDTRRLGRHVFGRDAERLDQSLVRLMLGRLSAFPPGTLVRLSNGEVGVVARRESRSAWQPQAALAIVSAHGRLLEVPRARQLNARELRVVAYVEEAPARLAHVDWPGLWGYRH